jgi:hypothetical protein
MASNSNGKNLKNTGDAVYMAIDADLWNGAIGIYFSSTHDGTKLKSAGGLTGLASDGTFQLEVGMEPPGGSGLNGVITGPDDAAIIDWEQIKMYDPNADAKVSTLAPAGTFKYLWAELVGVKFARVKKTDSTANGCWVRIADRRG